MKKFSFKYGEVKQEVIKQFCNRLVSNVFKILPMKEEQNNTVSKHIESLNREIYGMILLCNDIELAQSLLSVMAVLENIILEEDKVVYKSDIFKCITIIKKIVGDDIELQK